ncbi:hypothetical protein [Kamptonema formosum]|nr:hypothetical protein [Oscillatoria sp. PCC 10802]
MAVSEDFGGYILEARIPLVPGLKDSPLAFRNAPLSAEPTFHQMQHD